MKKFIFVITVLLLTNCSGYHTMPKFYERHNQSTKVEAYQLPKFKDNVMDSLSPYTRNLLLDVTDMRYIKLVETDVNNNELLKLEIKNLFRRRFKDLQREITNDSLKIISYKTSDNIATEFLLYHNKGLENTILYIAGDMDPNSVREFYNAGEYNKIIAGMKPEFFEEIDSNLKDIEQKAENAKKKN